MERKLDVISLDSVEIKDIQDNSMLSSPVIKYMYIVQNVNQSAASDELEQNGILFCRGQAKDTPWRVDPSVFREAQLEREHELIREAIRFSPGEFANTLTKFERLTKLQHHWLPTRLLDVTENPLMALYFACEQEADADGAVYMTHTYPVDANALQVQILSHIAHLDMRGITLRELWTSLLKEGIDIPSFEDIIDSNSLDNYINLMKLNYFVRPNLDNSRIKQQSGAFLLSGCINTLVKSNKWDSILEKKDKCLAGEFTHKIIIPSELKNELLEELDLYNVNVASAYPELDYQMRYIKSRLSSRRSSFSSAAGEDNDSAIQEDYKFAAKNVRSAAFDAHTQEHLVPDNLSNIVSNYIHDERFIEPVCQIFISHAGLDWTVRKQLQAEISSSITRYLFAHDYNESLAVCADAAKSILEHVLFNSA